MVKAEILQKVSERVYDTANIRNICVIAHVDHGKSTLTDSLISAAGLISQSRAGQDRFMDTRPDEQERTITIKSTAVSLPFDVPYENKNPNYNPNWPDAAPSAVSKVDDEETDAKHEDDEEAQTDPASSSPSSVSAASASNPAEPQGKPATFLVNVIDSPGHIDFSSEVTSALRITDGALVVVDCIEGVCVQTRTVLRQALTERIKPVLFLNKLDRVFQELGLDLEDTYQKLARTVESVNVVISSYQHESMGDVTVYPQAGTVGFGSGLQGWAFTLWDFAKIYHTHFNISPRKMMKKLWGDNFYNPQTKSWTTEATAGKKTLERAFVQLVLRPLQQVFRAVKEKQIAKLEQMLQKLSVTPNVEVSAEVPEKELVKGIMQGWLPASRTLIRMITEKLPSPQVAQRYRTEVLYSGPQDDETATAMRLCDPKGELVMFVSKMLPTTDNARFYALARVFSGTVSTGQQVRIQGPDYVPGSKDDLYEKRIQKTVVMMGPYIHSIDAVPAGGIVGLIGVDQFLVKNGTITTIKSAFNLNAMKYSVAPVVRVAVRPENPAQMPKLTQGLQRLVKSDPLVQVIYNKDTNEYVVAGCGELHLEICIKDLREQFMEGCAILVSNPVVPYRETITVPSSFPLLSKSPNGLNRIQMEAEPLAPELVQAIAEHKLSLEPRTNDDVKARNRQLAEDFKWDINAAKKIWAFGQAPDGDANVIVDATKGIAYVNEVRDLITAEFSNCSVSGVLAGEPLCGVRFNVSDMKIHSDSVHRGVAQIAPCTRRVISACQLACSPRLMEPMFLCEITTPQSCVTGVYQTLRSRRAIIKTSEDETQSEQNAITGVTIVQAYLPVAESFGFNAELRKNTGGQALEQMIFSHYQVLDEDPTDPKTRAYQIVMQIRKRKRMKPEMPVLEDYHQPL